jgi:hypothetical protein
LYRTALILHIDLYLSIFAYGSRLRMLGGVFWLRLDTHTAGERSTLSET